MKKPILILAALAAALLFPACTTVKYEGPNGVKVSATSVLNRRAISKASFDPATGKLTIEGYSNEQTDVAVAGFGAVTAALERVPKVP